MLNMDKYEAFVLTKHTKYKNEILRTNPVLRKTTYYWEQNL